MQVTVETKSGLERRLVINVPADKVNSEVEKRIKDTARKVRLDGFRPGKVPVSVVRQRFGAGIRAEALEEVVRESYVAALEKEAINPAGYPRFEEVKEEDDSITIAAMIEVYPEVELKSFADLSLDQVSAEISEENIDKMIDTLLKERAKYNTVERASQSGDQVVCDFLGKIDGEAFEGGAAEKQAVLLGSGSMIPGFEEGLVGMSAGESKVIDVTFPEDYNNKELAGKAATFDITMHEVNEQVLPELDAAFFTELGARETTLEAFRGEVKDNMVREAGQALRAKLKAQVIDQLIEAHEFDVPSSMVEQEVNRLRQEAVQQFGGNAKIDPAQLPKELFEEQAVRRVKVGLLFSKIVEQNGLTADDASVRAFIEKLAAVYQDPQSVIDYYYNNREQMSQVQAAVLEDAVVDAVLKDAQIAESTVDYYAAVQKGE